MSVADVLILGWFIGGFIAAGSGVLYLLRTGR